MEIVSHNLVNEDHPIISILFETLRVERHHKIRKRSNECELSYGEKMKWAHGLAKDQSKVRA